MGDVNDVWVFGDSHWRVFFPFVNNGAATDNVSHTQDGIRTIDTIANELAGSTMYGLLQSDQYTGNQARKRILDTIDGQGGVDNVGLVFGEVDCRFHRERYFTDDGKLSIGRIYETVSRYRRFIDEDLLFTNRVRGLVFVYFGFAYPRGADTPTFSLKHPLGQQPYERADMVRIEMGAAIDRLVLGGRVHGLIRDPLPAEYIDEADGVHLIPERIYPSVLNMMRRAFDRQAMAAATREVPL